MLVFHFATLGASARAIARKASLPFRYIEVFSSSECSRKYAETKLEHAVLKSKACPSARNGASIPAITKNPNVITICSSAGIEFPGKGTPRLSCSDAAAQMCKAATTTALSICPSRVGGSWMGLSRPSALLSHLSLKSVSRAALTSNPRVIGRLVREYVSTWETRDCVRLPSGMFSSFRAAAGAPAVSARRRGRRGARDPRRRAGRRSAARSAGRHSSGRRELSRPAGASC
jgi:hypothetical protein